MATSALHICSCPKPDCVRVLIVDDEPGILFGYRKLLEQEGITVDSCDCLCEALEHLARHQYLAVVADMRLRGSDVTDGITLVHEIRRHQPAAGIIVATGTSDEQTRQAVAGLGVDHYLEKPVHPLRILDLLDNFRLIAKGSLSLLAVAACVGI